MRYLNKSNELNKKRKAIILDRDGVINVDTGYVHKISEFEFIEGTFEALKKLQEKYLLLIFTSQSGIGREYYKEEDYYILTKHMLKEFEKKNIKIQEIVFCPHSPEARCKCRKPQTTLVEPLIKKYNIDVEQSYMIGDKTSDIQLGKNLNMKTVLVMTGKAGKDKLYDTKPDIFSQNLLEACKIILNYNV